ncbi:MAG: alanine dehydrogenase [Candidatus Omnitrophica bacterium]|nr:alanine dehydrogenase [Candidatus Omnitrophota bacterium]
MIIGIPNEIIKDENRVAIVPVGVEELTLAGHIVLIEKGAGLGTGISDAAFQNVGAVIVETAGEIYRRAECIIKVKEPQSAEYDLLKENQILFCYLHLAANERLTRELLKRKVTALAYETVQDEQGGLPLLTPMSEVAGRMSIQEGAKCLEKPAGGKGILLGGVTGVKSATVVILGGGIVGTNAAKVAAGLGANVAIMDTNHTRLRYLEDVMPKNVMTLASHRHNIRDAVREADLVVAAALHRGERAPSLIPASLLKQMKPGSAIVDVAIDQGGCCETSRPTTHSQPAYIVDEVVHYCVTNMPGAVAGTSTYALTNVTLPYVYKLANKGLRESLRQDTSLRKGLNLINGRCTLKPIAEQYQLSYAPPEDLL